MAVHASLCITTGALEIRRVQGKGRGVFARRAFAPGEIVERCPVIAMPGEQWEHVDRTALEAYCFKWGADLQTQLINGRIKPLFQRSSV